MVGVRNDFGAGNSRVGWMIQVRVDSELNFRQNTLDADIPHALTIRVRVEISVCTSERWQNINEKE